MRGLILAALAALAAGACEAPPQGETAARSEGAYRRGAAGQGEETYRLVHAIGNTESEVARGLSQGECRRRRDEMKEVATALGTYNEPAGRGSITCLPESFFAD